MYTKYEKRCRDAEEEEEEAYELETLNAWRMLTLCGVAILMLLFVYDPLTTISMEEIFLEEIFLDY